LLSADSSVLLVVDFQDKLLVKIPVAESVLASAVKLIRFARELAIPILWAEQYPKGLGPTTASISTELAGTPFTKTSFGCLGDAAFRQALADTRRKQLLVIGIETHVCVMQTVLAALEASHEVYVARDAVAAHHKSDHEAALARMERRGAELVTAEMAMFEVLRDSSAPEFKRVLHLFK
jgi:isochorismate hydrolase